MRRRDFIKVIAWRRPDQAASFSHNIETLRDSASLASRIRFPAGTALHGALFGDLPFTRLSVQSVVYKLLLSEIRTQMK
jgi:hypothetical protein